MNKPDMIYLASRSPRRRELLAQIGVAFEPLLFRDGDRADREVDESPLSGEDPLRYVQRVAQAKVTHGVRLLQARHLAVCPVLSADTTLDLDGQIVGKPENDADAQRILQALSGRTHRVLTAIAVSYQGKTRRAVNMSDVRFRTLSALDIQRYLVTGEHRDKAGAYGIQGHAGMFVEHISGSYTGIMGLPLCETAQLLNEFSLQF
ncbi:MAG: septum formation inhibitor Maf [Pseudomonadota bacterium]|jgi:septum formation protein